jgi:hypothetical protein
MADELPGLPIQVKINADLNAVSESFTKLVETVSSGVGAVYEGRRIREKAKAEADADVTHAKAAAAVARIQLESSFELREIAERAERRVHANEIRRQKNIEAIVSMAAQQLPAHVSNEPVDEDWAVQFFQFCQDIGNEEMREVWARLLAGEVTKPRSYSLRTLSLVRTLNQSDARLFKNFCNFLWNGTIILRPKTNAWFASRIRREEYLHLETLGLLSRPLLNTINPGESRSYTYDKQYLFRNPEKNRAVDLIEQLLTASATELVTLCDVEYDQEYLEIILEDCRDDGITVEPVGSVSS